MTDRPSAGFGINVYGHLTGLLGLGVAARNTLHAMAAQDVPRCVVDMDAGQGRSRPEIVVEGEACASPGGRYPVSLFHSNPTDVYSFAIDVPADTWAPDTLRACVPFWELPHLPAGVWRPFLSACDLVLAPSRFVADTVSADCPDARVVHYPQAVFLSDDVRPDRAAWGIPEGAFAALVVMDASSGFERKNPLGAAEAFRRAFRGSDRSDAVLIVKMNDARTHALYSEDVELFRREAAVDPRIMVIEESMTYRDVLSLNASCDALLSLHRSEGLGLNLMEAMSLGTVVVATAWSGNMDFTTPENSILVPFRRVPVVSKHSAYAPSLIGEDQTWADPDIDEAARSLRALADDPELRKRLSGRAAADMETARAAFLRGVAAAELERLWDEGARARPRTRAGAQSSSRSCACRRCAGCGV
jgi:glycosyltransferase involved in cell wall biosynthesis